MGVSITGNHTETPAPWSTRRNMCMRIHECTLKLFIERFREKGACLKLIIGTRTG